MTPGPRPTRGPSPPERASGLDLMQLASDVGPAPAQVGALLVLDGHPALSLPALRVLLAERVATVPRLRQRLVRAPFGCGRPVWVDDARFDPAQHVHAVACPAPGDEAALLEVTAGLVAAPLPADRPRWSATLVTGLAGQARPGGQDEPGGTAPADRQALVVVFHHVLADGIGGLAVLAQLVDGGSAGPDVPFPRPAPSWWTLLVDATSTRLRALTHVARVPRIVRDALAELGPGSSGRAPRCSLNRPTGPDRRLAVARVDLGAAREAAHAHAATVNDVILTAATGALHTLGRHRGEDIDRAVVSVAVSGRAAATSAQVGNHVGVIPVDVPAAGEAEDRLAAIATVTRARKMASRAASAQLLAPIVRVLAWLGVLRRLVERQRLVTTFVTNLRGPGARLSLGSATVTDVVAVNAIAGNVTVAFGALSYAGTLAVTVVADRDAWPDLPVLAHALQDQLDALAATAADPAVR